MLLEAGYAVLNPMLSMAHMDGHNISWETWIASDLAFIEVCDLIVRLPGESKGADLEVAHATERGIPVFNATIDTLPGAIEFIGAAFAKMDAAGCVSWDQSMSADGCYCATLGRMAPCSWCTDPDRNLEEQELSIQNVLRALPVDAANRKAAPIMSGAIDYFPLALVEVARISKAGNDQHNPGQPLHWARGKSTDHADCVVRHMIERGTIDSDGQRHTAKAAWRILALLQEEMELATGWTPANANNQT